VKSRQSNNKANDEVSAPINRRVVRNVDPFERKRRLAYGQSDFARNPEEAQKFSSRKILSKSEAR
jgi:hypothetical protein